MGYVEVKEVKEYSINLRGDREMDIFKQLLVNSNPVSQDMKVFRDNLLNSCRAHSETHASTKRPLDKQGLPDLTKEPK